MPFEIPENWVWTTIGEVFNLQAGRFVEASQIYSDSTTIHPYPCFGGNGLRGYVSDYNREGIFPIIGRQGALCGNINLASSKFYATEHAIVVETFCNMNCYWSSYVLKFLNLNQYATATAQPGLSVKTVNEVCIPIPPLSEQARIVNAIGDWFAIIDKIEQEQVDLTCAIKQTKSKILDIAIHGKLVPQDPNDEPAIELLRRINPSFKPCDNAHYKNLPSGWSICRLEDIVDYEQPQAYIVGSTNYSEDYSIPVLTAGKSFIIGYTNEIDGICDNLPVIIFDDFTTDSRFVDFPFKVKSSAMKILRVKKGIDIQYVGFYMSITRLVGDTHKRYWISEYSKLPIPIPPKAEQERIVQTVTDLLGKLDNIIAEL